MKAKFHNRLPSGAVSWALYDCANSAFALTVLAGFYGPFFRNYWSGGSPSALTWQGYTVSISGLIVALMAPFLGALADHRGRRKRFLLVFMTAGAAATALLAGIGEGVWPIASLVYIVAAVGFYGANLFYDALLPTVSRSENRHTISGLGFSLGYFGSVILFGAQITLVQNPSLLGLSSPDSAIKASFLSVALWWVLFSFPLLNNVQETPVQPIESARRAINASLRELGDIVRQTVSGNRTLFWFLLAYWFYIDGAYTLITMATGYGAALGFSQYDLMVTLVIVQVLGVPFSLMFGLLGQRFRAGWFIMVTLAIYLAVTLFSSRMTSEPFQLSGLSIAPIYILGAFIGMAQGGLQSLSRSLYSSLIPADKSASYFGLYNMVGRGAAILGPFLLAFVASTTGDPRNGALAIAVLFLIGAVLLLKSMAGKCRNDR